MSKRRYLLRRLALAVLVLVGVLAMTFVVARVIPSDPAALYAGPRPRPEQVAELRVKLGLDQPLPTQFVRYVGNILQGDLGDSFKTRRAILSDLRIFLPATLELVSVSTLLAVIIGIRSECWRRRADAGRLCQRFLAVDVSIPTFWLARRCNCCLGRWAGAGLNGWT
jgi:peptide/nickel transport system permease protein